MTMLSRQDHEADWLKSKLELYRQLTLDELIKRVPRHFPNDTLRELILDYPTRGGKGFRPSLCMSTCEAFGGRRSDALNSAVAIELFHNAFLVHDDIEDGSHLRRGLPTLHIRYGIPLAINAGDAMNVLTLRVLLDNFGILGAEKTQRIFEEIDWMVLQSVEGQAIELGWVDRGTWSLQYRDYFRMCLKKTGWYTCITPCRIGAIVGGACIRDVNLFNSFGYHLGLAFQIQDDILNLNGDVQLYGKEAAGDLWEGKRTLMLLHVIHHMTDEERVHIMSILDTPRDDKQEDDIVWILSRMDDLGSIEFAKDVAWRFANHASFILENRLTNIAESEARHFLRHIVDYMVNRQL